MAAGHYIDFVLLGVVQPIFGTIMGDAFVKATCWSGEYNVYGGQIDGGL